MTIVCGTDLSHSAVRAAQAAAAIAHRLAAPLKLVRVIDELGAELAFAQSDEAFAADRERLRAEADELRRRFEVDVEPIVVPGRAHDQIIAIATRSNAELVVVAAVGRTQAHRWLLGSVAEQVTRYAPVPVLVIRNDAPISAWAKGERTLEIVVGVDLSTASRTAMQWAAGLRRLGPCNLQIVQLVSPAHESVRLGTEPPRPPATPETLAPEVEELLLRDLRAWVGAIPGPGETHVEVYGYTGRVDWQLSQIAGSADLVVLGTHQRTGFDRVWKGSVSRGVLKHASTNVACIPGADSLARRTARPARIQRVLVPTDFSPLANRAIPVAYGLVPPDGVVHLMHVVAPGSGNIDQLKQCLRELIPTDLIESLDTDLHVIEADDAPTAISQAAGRLEVDLVCMATHGRTGLSAFVLGSEAQRVVSMVRQPVVLVPPERSA